MDECVICLGELPNNTNNTLITTCVHKFHSYCIKKYVRFKKRKGQISSCPICRSDISYIGKSRKRRRKRK